MKPITGKLSLQQYVSIRDEWYKKLKDEGFDDIEYHLNNGEPSHICSTTYLSDRDLFRMEMAQAYFSKASDALHRFKFKSERDRDIWEHHCDGLTIRDIAKRLKLSTTRTHAHITRIRKAINQWRKTEQKSPL